MSAPTRPSVTVETTVQLVVSLLLIGSGVTAVLADAPRWWPHCVGGFGTEECLARQDNAYGLLPPGPEVGAGDASSVLAGLSVLLTTLAVIGLFHVLVPNRWSWLPGSLLAAPFALLVPLLLGIAPVHGWTESTGPALTVGLISLLWPLALTTASAVRLAHPSTARRSRWPVVGAAVLVIASPIPLYLGMSTIYQAHDLMPWLLTVIGLLTVLAGVAFLLGRDKPAGQSPPRSAATGSSEAALSAG